MEGKHPMITVVYLAWLPYGVEYFRDFIRSYISHPAGVSHQLLICYNGVTDDTAADEHRAIMDENGILRNELIFREGQDIEIYIQVAQKLETSFILFLNTYSTLLADEWLVKFSEPFHYAEVGIVGASASYQSYYSSVFFNNSWSYEPSKGFLANFRKYKLLLKTLLYWRFLFDPFPNPHIRTNAFMVRRQLIVRSKHCPPTTKFRAYLFENGKNNLTKQILSMGYKALVVDRRGTYYEMRDWGTSNTFRSSSQENLLVADNQTRIYADATAKEKKALRRLTWGSEE